MSKLFAICEDEAYFAANLRKMIFDYLKERAWEAEVLTFESGEALIGSDRRPDVVLMDVKLPGKAGTEIVETLKNAGCGCQVIFITAYKEYVFRAFDLGAVHYILKPVCAEKLHEALDRAVERMGRERERALLLFEGERAVKVPFREISYCEVFDHRISIHTASGEYQMSGTLEALEEELDGRFFRCHRSFLINMDCVAEREAGAAVVSGGSRVLVSRRREQEFRRRLLESLKERGI